MVNAGHLLFTCGIRFFSYLEHLLAAFSCNSTFSFNSLISFKDICGKYFLHCKLLKTLHIFSFRYWFTIFKIKMIRHRAKSFTIWPGMTPHSTVFPKICANNSVNWLYDKNSIRLAFNFIILSRTIQEMILIHICCSFVKMRQESAMPVFDTT